MVPCQTSSKFNYDLDLFCILNFQNSRMNGPYYPSNGIERCVHGRFRQLLIFDWHHREFFDLQYSRKIVPYLLLTAFYIYIQLSAHISKSDAVYKIFFFRNSTKFLASNRIYYIIMECTASFMHCTHSKNRPNIRVYELLLYV